jgi:hypothetical protein
MAAFLSNSFQDLYGLGKRLPFAPFSNTLGEATGVFERQHSLALLIVILSQPRGDIFTNQITHTTVPLASQTFQGLALTAFQQ